jgi:poly(A) polymerase
VAAEREAGIEPQALRRLAALLPPDQALADAVAARLKLSNRARKRLVAAAEADLGFNPQALAYGVGVESAVDRLLLAGEIGAAKAIEGWAVPRLPISGGALIERGVEPGPAVSLLLRCIEQRWLEAGFPNDARLDRIVEDEIARNGPR